MTHTGQWVVPLGGQLDLLARWLEPIVDRPGLAPVAPEALHIVVAPAVAPEAPAFEPFDALVGPVRVDATGVLADVIPVEPFLALRSQLGAEGHFAPQVVFAHADGTHELEQLEAVASEAVLVGALALIDADDA